MAVRRRPTGERATRGLIALLSVLVLVLAACGNGDDDAASEPDTESIPEENDPLDDLTEDCRDAFIAMEALFAGAPPPGAALDLDSAVELLGQMAAVAPSAVRSDFEVILDAFEDLQGQLDAVGLDAGDPTAIPEPVDLEALEELGSAFEDPAFERAAENIDTFFDEACPELDDLEGD